MLSEGFDMKTKLPDKITTWEQAKDFLRELHDNGEHYHPEDDAFDVCWGGYKEPSDEEKAKLNQLMDNIYSLPEMKDYPNVDQCPCGFLNELDKVKAHL